MPEVTQKDLEERESRKGMEEKCLHFCSFLSSTLIEPSRRDTVLGIHV